jgi:hypothetical protein
MVHPIGPLGMEGLEKQQHDGYYKALFCDKNLGLNVCEEATYAFANGFLT